MKSGLLIDEVRSTRDAIAKECGNDLAAVFRMLREIERTSEFPHVTLPARLVNAGPVNAIVDGNPPSVASEPPSRSSTKR